jgi:serine/threonine-protein kinase
MAPESVFPPVERDCCRRFEEAWGSGRPLPVEDCLPPPEHPLFLTTLEELVVIDLEFRSRGRGAGPPPRLEDYLRRFPRLREPERLRRLMREEARARRRCGETPTTEEYQDRFPEAASVASLGERTVPQLGGGSAPPRLTGYEVLEELGRGGMGVVYKARHLALDRVVALKVMQGGGWASLSQLARFRAEAGAVARLQHPHIVQVFEVGEWHPGEGDAPSPFFALEYVEGGSLAHALAHRPQPATASARLAEMLARAVHHAHERGIVHRDLKPANVLLKSRGAVEEWVPKVADFGLAKRLGGDAGQAQTEEIMGTPAYMAPEQAEDGLGPVGPAADVYALGAILYEMLTGRPPFQADKTFDLLMQVRTADPVPPSRLVPKVPRDLETVCLKCLRKEPAKRYASALDLADDLGRFLRGEPIQARPASVWERGWKWARRRPAAAALAAVTTAAVLTVLVVVLVANARLQRQRDIADERRREADAQRRRAVTHLKEAREAVDELLTRVGFERLDGVPYMETVRRDLLKDALRYYEGFAREESDDPEIRWETGRAWRRLGKIHAYLGERDAAEQSYREAVKASEQLTAEYPDSPEYRSELAASLNNFATLLEQPDQAAERLEVLRRAIDLQEKLAGEFPNDVDYRHDLAESYDQLGRALTNPGQATEAERAIRQAVEVMEKVVADAPDDLKHRLSLALCNRNLGVFLANRRRLEEAEPLFRHDLEFWDKLADEQPAVPRYRGRAGDAAFHLGNLLGETGRAGEGEKLLGRCVGRRQSLVEEYPRVPTFQVDLAGAQEHLARALLKRGDFAGARPLLEQAVAHLNAGAALDARSAPCNVRSSFSWLLADTLLRLGEYREAARLADELPGICPEQWRECYQAARLLTRCVPAANQDTPAGPVRRRELVEQYSKRAVELLRLAHERGYTNVAFMKTDPGLDVLRGREDFTRLMRELDNSPR